ncbi:hypothetical protein MFIFM68171_00616 [Madurella fahalii]|uniref:Uncharacterized protein n=1 Tax=Madurella fahalii TaxID=1157608 RepID=A0ABQ0FY20_9PEZI
MDNPSDEPTEFNLVCLSLKHRPVWVSAAAQLLQSSERRWREASLRTHDLTLSVPRTQMEGYDAFRLVLLSPDDVDNAQTIGRIQQFYHLDGGRNAAIVLLLDQDGIQGAMQPLMKLHLQIMSNKCKLSVIPLTSLDALPIALNSFCSALVASRIADKWSVDATRDLLPYCTINTPLTRHSMDMLGMDFFSFRELLSEVAKDEGKGRVRCVLGPAETERFLAFWAHEFAAT